MNLAGASRILLGLAAACAVATAARAEGFTDEEETLFAIDQQHGPIALSGDGRWRVHVDAANVMHRASLADPSQSRELPIGEPVRTLVASRSAQKVAFAGESGCIGMVDFGSAPDAVPRVSWRQVSLLPDGRQQVDPTAWTTVRPDDCSDFAGVLGDGDQLALSADGRLLATAGEITDVDAHRVVLSRPRSHVAGREDKVLKLRFLEHDTRLAVVTATLGEAYEGARQASGLQASVWDVATRALWSFAELAEADLATPQGMFADILPGGLVLWGDATRRAAPGGERPPVDLMQWSAAACAAPPVRRAGVQPWQWVSFVVDPRGRWIAGMRKVERTGATDELVVADIATGRTLVERAFKHEVHGLVASADGTTLYGVSARSVRLPGDGLAPVPVGPANSVGEVIEVSIPQAGLAAPAAAPAWGAQPCATADEAPDARRVEHFAHVFAPAWTLPLVPEQRPGSGGLADAASADCDAWCGTLFAMRDGSVWLDLGARLAALDTATGRTARSLPTPRSGKVDSVPLPAADGFFNGQGDTLTWRPFEASASAPARRVIDVRPGFQVLRMLRRDDTVMVVWVRKPDAKTPRDPEGQPIFDAATYVLYDAAGRRLSEMPGHEQCGESCAEEPVQPALLRERALPCHDERGALANGFDWRGGPFDSVRVFACGPTPGAARLVFWDGVDAAPRNGPPPVVDMGARVVAHDGTLGVVRLGNRLHVFDAAARRELGQVVLPTSLEREQIVPDAARGLLLVVSSAQDESDRRVLRAYRVR